MLPAYSIAETIDQVKQDHTLPNYFKLGVQEKMAFNMTSSIPTWESPTTRLHQYLTVQRRL